MLEHLLIKYCSPTLASIKTASLFRLPYSSREELHQCINTYRDSISSKGVSITLLLQSEHSALIYVYRESKLRMDLEKPGVANFLRKFGYCYKSPEEAINYLTQRFTQEERFPHEIGLFLGYPLWDVCGFIYHQGKNCKYTGYWKVYSHESGARELFDRFDRCKRIYQRLWQDGKSLIQLTVAA